MKTQTLLLLGGAAVVVFLIFQQQNKQPAAPQTGISLGFNPDGSLSNASLGLDGLLNIFA